jgi:hypothetical protein
MEALVRRYALQVLRAIRDQHPNVGVGTSWGDPYTGWRPRPGWDTPMAPSTGRLSST